MIRPPFFRLLPCALAIWAVSASASDLDSEAKSIAKNAEATQAAGAKYLEGFKQQTPSEDVLQLAEDIVGKSTKKALENLPAAASQLGIEMPRPDAAAEMTGDWVDILVSRSLGETELKQIIAAAEKSPVPVRFIFRGIADGQRINDAFIDYGRWAQGLEKPPQATLDPTVFQDHNVQRVPHMLYMRDGEVLASVEGLSNADWLREAVERGERGHLGTRGPVELIAERDLIEVMKERAAGLDLESRKQKTVDTYWERANFITLRPAIEDRQREIDPSFSVNEDLKDPNGNIIVRAGTVINPLRMQPFTLRLVVFNPTRKAEVEWVAGLQAKQGIQDILIATEVDREASWKGFEALQDRLDQPVYMLQSDVRQRFQLQRTPSLVTSANYQFIVSEFAIKDPVDTGAADAKP